MPGRRTKFRAGCRDGKAQQRGRPSAGVAGRSAEAPARAGREFPADADRGPQPGAASCAAGARWPSWRGLFSAAREDLFEHDARVGDVVQAVLAIALEAAAQQRARAPAACRPAAPRSRCPAGARPRACRRSSRRRRAAAGQHLEQHDAERPDVGALVDARGRAPAPGVM